MNNRIGEFIWPFIVLHHNECFNIVSRNQDGAIKRYSTSQITPFLEQASTLDDSITEHKIEDLHDKTDKDLDEPEFDSDSVQLNADQQSYGEQSITDVSDNVNTESKQQSTISPNDTPRRVTLKQTQSARGMATRTRSQSQTHMISLGYLNDTRQSLTRFAESPQCRLIEIFKPNDPRANCSKMIEAKYAEIRDLVDRGTFQDVLRTELPDGANLITRYALAINKMKIEKNDTRQDTLPEDIWIL